MESDVRKKVLIIEDDQSLASAYRAKLAPNYDTRSETTGDSGLKMAYDWKPHLIILDLFLPEKSGEEVLKELKKDEGTRNIPVIVLTNLEGQCGRMLEIGAQECSIKSDISMEDIITKINTYLA